MEALCPRWKGRFHDSQLTTSSVRNRSAEEKTAMVWYSRLSLVSVGSLLQPYHKLHSIFFDQLEAFSIKRT